MVNLIAAMVLVQSVVPISVSVDGVERTGILVKPSEGKGEAPLVFGFHGHGGGARQAQRSFDLEEAWPEAAVVYLQGLPTPGQLTDPEGEKNGWQGNKGDQGDRDLKFFDAALKWVEGAIKIDQKQIYCMGHSNGGAFTYLLGATHPGLFAAIGVSAGGFRSTDGMTPVPTIHIAGESDPLVKYRGQVFNVGRVRKVNECATESKPWGDVAGAEMWESSKDSPVVLVTHPGGHEYLSNASELFVKFFKQHGKPKR